MPLEITPEPSDAEREAIERALEQAAPDDSSPPAYLSPWRRAALDEASEPDTRP